ncbi:ATP-binding cassette domain-containing protein [Agrobacterium pusense]|uniref:ATP-binding cassette domain-containing protein n=1 Tax=Agrobacterium pusense TaxID=648995 RepID=A0AA44IXG7_9HYPH|nr:ATP-binding cassette domain-containing protein [Agrobacterium pusense]NRF07547.1 ATP-binding cassette domain-containing protein [Agrobacterium pusense]NRF18279.1 ATP-binding cassette domain-containing protein [Agrobacterium pusense]
MSDRSILRFEHVGHAFLGRSLFENFDLGIAPGETVALLGPSGSGKTTILQIAAGIIDPVRGRVHRHYRRQGLVFQEPRLLPWMTLIDNIAYGLAAAGMRKRERRERAGNFALEVGLEVADFGKYPVELSGGMRQRAGVARALAVEPDMLFLDEPFSAVDVGLRRHLQELLVGAARRRGFSTLLVTHDLHEALLVADRLIVLSGVDGRITAAHKPAGSPGRRMARAVFDEAERLSESPAFAELFSARERVR